MLTKNNGVEWVETAYHFTNTSVFPLKESSMDLVPARHKFMSNAASLGELASKNPTHGTATACLLLITFN